MLRKVTEKIVRPAGRARPSRLRSTTSSIAPLAVGLFALASCSPQMHHNRADRESYSILANKTPAVENVDDDDVELSRPEAVDLSDLSVSGSAAEFLGEMSVYERGAHVMPLDEALETGISYGRDYLEEKEDVFLGALDLTLARHRLSPIFFGNASAERASDTRQAQLQQGMTELVATNTFARTQSGGFNWLYRTGARISTNFTRDFFRIMTGNSSVNESDLAVSIAQPLLQGGGTTVTLEALTQEERNVLYDLRDFADFRRAFIVGLVDDYYGVLRARDQVENAYVAHLGFQRTVKREEALAEEDRRTQTQLGQLRQAALQAESRWINAIRTYQTRLDDYKLALGIPVEEKIILDSGELSRLSIESPDITREQAVEVALVTRPDLSTAADRIYDAERRVAVAENGLLPGLDVTLDYNAVSDPGDTTPAINFDRRRWEGSLDLDLPLDRKSERNTYRAALIDLERARRSWDEQEDAARLEIYDAWRALEQARRNFDIAEQGVEVATRRLEEQQLLAELGQGEARDLIEAQNDLVDAQNQRTSTLIDHTLARLRLWRDMGILYVNDDGSWATKLRNEVR